MNKTCWESCGAKCIVPALEEMYSMDLAESVVSTIGLVATIVLGILAITGTGNIGPMEWGVGVGAFCLLTFVTHVAHSCRKIKPGSDHEATKGQKIFAFALLIVGGTLVGLTMAGYLPLKPIAITFVAIAGLKGVVFCHSCAAFLKFSEK